jgi:Cu(I)/Ag(I) efflux system membrane fusion protein
MKNPKLVIGICLAVWSLILGFPSAHAQMEDMSGMSAEEHEKMQMEHGPAPAANQVMVTPDRQQLIGVKTETAKVVELKNKIRTVGTVAYDPELYAAQNEYLEALNARGAASQGEDQYTLANAEELVAAAHLKLKRLGLSDDLILKIKQADLSLLVGSQKGLVWIYGKIYENEVPLVKEGMTVYVTARSLPGKMFMGKIASIDTVLDEMTRSLKVRSAVVNEKGMLKPNMFVDLMIEARLGKKLAVPEDAVLDTGERQVLFVDQGKGIFEKREVVAGQRADGLIEIVKGLKAGEKVVTSGTFLIDSESKLKSTGGGGHVH